MSQYRKQYDDFFGTSAGISLLTWLQDMRDTERDKNEKDSSYISHGIAYKEILEHIDSVRTGMVKTGMSRSSGGEGTA